MNILEGVHRLNQELQEQNGKLFGADGVEISLHHLCAPDHQEIQGRQFSNEEWQRINGSLKRPIGTLNCGHHVSPIILAAAKPVYTAQERAEAIARSNETVEYNGRKMTRYEASQRMRARERKIRNMRSEEKALRAAGDTSGASAVKRDIRRRTAEYKKFCGDVGLEERMDRTYYFGSVSKKKLDNSGGSGIIKENIQIGRSLGAAGKNYPIKLPDGNHAKFVEGTEITKIKVFAGKGTNIQIREAIYLENDYGIPAGEWQKVRGEGTIIFEKQKRIAEVHWYEAEGKRVKMKVKRWLDES